MKYNDITVHKLADYVTPSTSLHKTACQNHSISEVHGIARYAVFINALSASRPTNTNISIASV